MNKFKIRQEVLFVLLTSGILFSFFSTDRYYRADAQTSESETTPMARPRFTPGPVRTIELDEPEWRENVPIQSLVSQSRAIIIGEVVSNKSNKLRNSQNVVTSYEIRIYEVLKGSVDPASLLTVNSSGGLVMESDGSILNEVAPAIAKMRNGKKYVMFLKNEQGSTSGVFRPISGSQGLYELTTDGTRLIHLGRSTYVGGDIGDASTFLREVRVLIHGQ